MCKAHPGMFELAIGGCGGKTTCNTTASTPGEETDTNAVFLVRSLHPAEMTVREAFTKFNIVAYRDYIFQNRQGLNSLRHSKADIPAPKEHREKTNDDAPQIDDSFKNSKAAALSSDRITAALAAEAERLQAEIALKQAQLESIRSRLPAREADQ